MSLITILEHHNDETTSLQQCCGQHSNVLSRLYTTSCWPEAGVIRWILQTVSTVRQLSRGEKCNRKAECLLRRISAIRDLSRWQSSHSETKRLLLPVSDVRQLPRGKSSDGEKDQVVHRFPKFRRLQLSSNPPYHLLPNSIPVSKSLSVVLLAMNLDISSLILRPAVIISGW